MERFRGAHAPPRVVAGALAGHVFVYYTIRYETAAMQVFGERGRPDRRVRRPAERSPSAASSAWTGHFIAPGWHGRPARPAGPLARRTCPP